MNLCILIHEYDNDSLAIHLRSVTFYDILEYDI